jgi:hypothetical protein
MIFGHIAGWFLWGTASDAIDLSRPARPFIFQSPGLEECGKSNAEDQHGLFAIGGRQSTLNPLADCVSMDAKESGNLVYRVIPMGFGESVIRMALAHHSLGTERNCVRLNKYGQPVFIPSD